MNCPPALLLASLIILPTGCVNSPRGFPAQDGIQNFDVVDGKVLRGSQFNHAALLSLARQYHTAERPLTVINLRNDPWSDEPALCRELGVHYYNFKLGALSAPSGAAVEAILATIEGAPGRVFVHCQFGCDRTGTVVACYRIRQGTPTADALNDAKIHGLSAFEVGMIEFIKRFR